MGLGSILSEIPWWLVVLVIVVLAIFIKIPYADKDIISGYSCQGSTVMVQTGMFGMLKMAGDLEASMKCIEYKSSRCYLTCKNAKPQCECQANIWDLVLRSPGDWMFG